MKKNSRIIFIDDDAELREEISDILSDEGYDVTRCGDGEKGLELIRKNKYSVILLDLKMPGIDGFGVLSRIKKDKIPASIIIMTGSMIEEKRLKELQGKDGREKKNMLRSVNAVLKKPFDIKKLLKTIKKLI